MNYELRCRKLVEKHRENPDALHTCDKGFLDSEAATFWGRVRIETNDACWNWKGGMSGNEGRTWIRGKCIRPHLMAWMLANDVSVVPERLIIVCCNPLCCNPAHITLGRIRFIDGERQKVLSVEPVQNHQPITFFEAVKISNDNRTENEKWLAREHIRHGKK